MRLVNVDPLGISTGFHRLVFDKRELATLRAAQRILRKGAQTVPEWYYEFARAEADLSELVGDLLR